MKKKVYLDHAATTPVDPRVQKAMEPYLSDKFGNTMSLHHFGQEAKIVLDESRRTVAGIIGAKPEEIIFTGSATESNNFALKGTVFANEGRGKHIIISAIEHPCIMESAKWLEKRGFEITRIGVDRYGMVDPLDIEKEIRKDTVLVSVIHASNEIGTIQPVFEIGAICKNKGVRFHTDATQTLGKIPINVNEMNVDMITASAHKMYGPKGVGFLFLKRGLKIDPLLHGGGQESNMRSSTVNVSGIAGFAKACEISSIEMNKENERISRFRDKIIEGVLKIQDSNLNGHPEKRISNNANFWFSFIEGESLIIRLDMMGVAVSTGSACSSNKLQPSHVLLATGIEPHQAHGSLRVSLGRWTTEEDVDYFLEVLPQSIDQLRKISPFGRNKK